MNSASILLDHDKIAEIIAKEESRIRLQDQSEPLCPLIVRIPLGQFDILGWLSSIPSQLRFYWSNRDRTLEYGGIGDLLNGYNWREVTPASRLDEVQSLLRRFDSEGKLRAFVGETFDSGIPLDATWKDFPQQCIHLPEVSVVSENGQTNALITLFRNPASDHDSSLNRILALLNTLDNSAGIQDSELDLSRRVDTPGREDWHRAVEASIDAITTGLIEKIVLARRTDFEVKGDVDPFRLFSRFTRDAANCYRVIYAPSQEAAFISISPERLFYCNRKLLSTEAVAGTIRRGETEIEDLALENRLRSNAKDRIEQSIVVEGITESLQPLCEKIEFSSSASVMKLARVQHLISEFRVILKDNTTAGSVLTALHPTAAVCGNPQQAARELLRKIESFSRGWYASAIGVVGAEQCELAVGIRSVVIRNHTISLFTGAGIVSQSDPEAEWQELEDKLHSILLSGSGLQE